MDLVSRFILHDSEAVGTCLCVLNNVGTELISELTRTLYKVVQICPGQTVTCLHTNSPGHI